jgi:hypothetical protein
MSRPPTHRPAYELTDAKKRDLTQLIQLGKPLPEKYRFILFEDKREVELVWNGKSRDVCTTVLPFQSLEHIDEPRTETKIQEDLFDSRGRQHKGWTNKLIWGDNKLILSSLKAGALRRQIEEAGGLKLIYIDPPFDVGADSSRDIEIGGCRAAWGWKVHCRVSIPCKANSPISKSAGRADSYSRTNGKVFVRVKIASWNLLRPSIPIKSRGAIRSPSR